MKGAELCTSRSKQFWSMVTPGYFEKKPKKLAKEVSQNLFCILFSLYFRSHILRLKYQSDWHGQNNHLRGIKSA